MAMVGVDSGSVQADSQTSYMAWTGVGGWLVPFYIHLINRMNSCTGFAIMMTAP